MNVKLIYLARRADTVTREDWPRTWKSHAIFASQFPVVEAGLDWLRYCNRVDTPTLGGKPVDLPMLSTAHDGVANVNRGPGQPVGGSGFSAEVRAQLDQDELRVFDSLVENFSFQCTEEAIREGLPTQCALYFFLPRRVGTSRGEFNARWDGPHADLVRGAIGAMPAIRRYGHNHISGAPPRRFAFDGIVEIWFETQDDAVRALAENTLRPILEDLGQFSDMDAAVPMLTAPCHGWPKDEALLKRQQDRAG